MSLWKQWSFWRTGFNRRMCRVQNAILGARVQLWRKTQGLIQKPAGGPPSLAELPLKLHCTAGDPIPVPQFCSRLLWGSGNCPASTFTSCSPIRRFHYPLSFGTGRGVESFVCFECMNVTTVCLLLTGLPWTCELTVFCVCYSSVVTVAASDGLGLRIYLWALWHWSGCNRDSNISWGWRILTLFYAALPTERLALELSYGLLFFSDIGILLKSPCSGRKLTGRKEKAEHLKGLFNCQNLLWTFYIMGFANYWLLVTNL